MPHPLLRAAPAPQSPAVGTSHLHVLTPSSYAPNRYWKNDLGSGIDSEAAAIGAASG